MKNKFVVMRFLVFIAIQSSMVMGMEVDPLRELKTGLASLKGKLGNLRDRLESLKGKLKALKGRLEELSKEPTVQGPYLTLVNGSLVEQFFPEKESAAIVNAASHALLGGGGIDGMIWNKVGARGSAARLAFMNQCYILRQKKAQSRTMTIQNPYRGDVDVDQIFDDNEYSYNAGEAGLTQAFGELADMVGYVIHAVGPVGERPNELTKAYQNSLERAYEAKLKIIAFCPISTGIYKYPINEAIPVAINAIVDWLKEHPDSGIEEIRLVTWDGKPEEYDTYKKDLQESPFLKEITAEADSIITHQLLNESSSNRYKTPPLVFCIKKD